MTRCDAARSRRGTRTSSFVAAACGVPLASPARRSMNRAEDLPVASNFILRYYVCNDISKDFGALVFTFRAGICAQFMVT